MTTAARSKAPPPRACASAPPARKMGEGVLHRVIKQSMSAVPNITRILQGSREKVSRELVTTARKRARVGARERCHEKAYSELAF